ncbi:hypothetical protein QE152_g3745 [Popillia japonica]|uniref:Uncharacterized protein n=1 Tax=Popillia japonica TaxID=7064 RepID=A0AAW1N2Q1_POPJA
MHAYTTIFGTDFVFREHTVNVLKKKTKRLFPPDGVDNSNSQLHHDLNNSTPAISYTHAAANFIPFPRYNSFSEPYAYQPTSLYTRKGTTRSNLVHPSVFVALVAEQILIKRKSVLN